MSRRDDVMELYKPSGILEKIEKILFCIDIIAALVSLVSSQVISSIAITVQIVVALLYFVSNTIDDGCFWYEAEKQRRKNGIQNGLGMRLSEYDTEEYYNNNLPPSLEKYGMNILESNYFSKIIAGKMLFKMVGYALGAVVALIIACRFVSNENILLIIAQTAFSSYVLVNFTMLVFYKIRMETLYSEAYNVLILGNRMRCHQAWLISYIVEYEAIKAHYKIRLEQKIFNNINSKLSAKWQDIVSHRVDEE
ncbi:MAG: hypothetical protein J6L77_01570 [Coprococcus sp.]|nr:hypothetical protein [Coprococcus sp.]